jgi:mannose-6-phosphate isomerase-like protein (cupin superfamily)
MAGLEEEEFSMRIIAAVSLVALLAVSIWAQQRGPAAAPAAATFFSAADVANLISKSPADRNALGQRMLQIGAYNVNLEHRVVSQAAAVHEKEAELFYVIEGSGTVITGGKLVGESRTNEANLTGTSIEGGSSKKVSKGDWFLVPEGIPHQIPNVDGALNVMTLHLPR